MAHTVLFGTFTKDMPAKKYGTQEALQRGGMPPRMKTSQVWFAPKVRPIGKPLRWYA